VEAEAFKAGVVEMAGRRKEPWMMTGEQLRVVGGVEMLDAGWLDGLSNGEKPAMHHVNQNSPRNLDAARLSQAFTGICRL
jgi:hypothetical protein